MSENQTALTYDDVQLIPARSSVESRETIDLTTQLSRNYQIMTPFIASCMDTICEKEMAFKMFQYGGVGCIHRFMSIEQQCVQVRWLSVEISNYLSTADDDCIWECAPSEIPIMAAIGIGHDYVEHAERLVDDGVNVILIDVAHGHHTRVMLAIKKLKEVLPKHVDVIAGNIATTEGAVALIESGVDGLRVGIGGGSLCTTRIKTGFGVPNLTAIQNIARLGSTVDIPIMADGGIRNSGDIAKALAFGADCVMLGSILSGTEETPGKIIEQDGALFKRYAGAASLETKSKHGQKERNIEGVSTMVPFKGGVKFTLEGLIDGLKSALSYGGAENIYKFAPEYCIVTTSGRIEASPHKI